MLPLPPTTYYLYTCVPRAHSFTFSIFLTTCVSAYPPLSRRTNTVTVELSLSRLPTPSQFRFDFGGRRAAIPISLCYCRIVCLHCSLSLSLSHRFSFSLFHSFPSLFLLFPLVFYGKERLEYIQKVSWRLYFCLSFRSFFIPPPSLLLCVRVQTGRGPVGGHLLKILFLSDGKEGHDCVRERVRFFLSLFV